MRATRRTPDLHRRDTGTRDDQLACQIGARTLDPALPVQRIGTYSACGPCSPSSASMWFVGGFPRRVHPRCVQAASPQPVQPDPIAPIVGPDFAHTFPDFTAAPSSPSSHQQIALAPRRPPSPPSFRWTGSGARTHQLRDRVRVQHLIAILLYRCPRLGGRTCQRVEVLHRVLVDADELD